MIKKAIGLAQGQLGDCIINTVAARSFKEQYPDYKLIMGVNKKYQEIIPLFYDHESFDGFHVYDQYDNWPNEHDKNYLRKSKYDIVFNAMPPHSLDDWWRYYHQTEESCISNGLPIPNNIQCNLTQWFPIEDNKDYITFNFVGAFYAGYPNNKSYNPEQAQQIVDCVRKLGYKVLLLGDPREPMLENAERKNLTIIESVKAMLGSRLFIGIDSFLTWAASAYSFPTVSCYANHYYGKTFVKNIQPKNPNGLFLDAPNVSEINVDEIISKAKDLMK